MVNEIYKPAQKVMTAFLAGMLLLVPAACTNDTEQDGGNSTVSEDNAVDFTVMLPNGSANSQSTRAFTTLDNCWTMNQEMAVCEGTTVYKYQAAENGGSGVRVALVPSPSNSGYFWSPLVLNRTFSAWYPYSSGKPTSWSGATDQRSDHLGRTDKRGTMTDEVYNDLDLLYAPDVTVGYKESVNLDFYHQMCRIVVTVNSTATKGAKPVTSIIFGNGNVAAGGTVTPGYTGSTSSTASWSVTQTQSVQMRLTQLIATENPTVRQYTYECIVPPQTLAATAVLFQITTTDSDNTDKTTNYVPQNMYTDAPNFQAGYQYNYMLTLSRQGMVSISTLQVSNWATENVTGLTATVPDAGY